MQQAYWMYSHTIDNDAGSDYTAYRISKDSASIVV